MVTRKPEAEEHGSKKSGATSWGKLGCMPPNGACRGTDITGTFRLPATPPVHVPARRLVVLSGPGWGWS